MKKNVGKDKKWKILEGLLFYPLSLNLRYILDLWLIQ